jgi:hypothetical protein
VKPLLQFIAPMMASVAKDPFDSPDWIFETKLDGYRAIAVINSAGHARIWSRNQLPLEQKFPTVGDSVNQLGLRSTVSAFSNARVRLYRLLAIDYSRGAHGLKVSVDVWPTVSLSAGSFPPFGTAGGGAFGPVVFWPTPTMKENFGFDVRFILKLVR